MAPSSRGGFQRNPCQAAYCQAPSHAMTARWIVFAFACLSLNGAYGGRGSVVEGESRIEPRWFEGIDGIGCVTKFVDLDRALVRRLVVRHISIADSGVELELEHAGVIIWRCHVQPLGVSHSRYHHEVTYQVEGGVVHVKSRGAKTIRETRSLSDGRLMSRVVSNN